VDLGGLKERALDAITFVLTAVFIALAWYAAFTASRNTAVGIGWAIFITAAMVWLLYMTYSGKILPQDREG